MWGIPVKWIIIAALVLAIFLAGWNYKAVVAAYDRIKAELGTANTTIGAQDGLMAAKDQINDKEREANEKILDAPASDDGPVAPVLLRTINSLR